MGLTCISLIRNVEHHLVCSLAICLLCKSVCSVPLTTFKLDCSHATGSYEFFSYFGYKYNIIDGPTC